MPKTSYDFILRRLATILSVSIMTMSVLAAVTGVLMSFYYEPVAGDAYQALNLLDNEVPNGLLIHSVHNYAGQGLIVFSLIQIVVMFLGRQFHTSWLTAWISGILLTLSAIGLSWTAMILDWSQLGYWRFNIELSTIEAIPFVGPELRDILTGGGAVNTTTVEHLYTTHSYLLPAGAIVLAIIHLSGTLFQEKQMNVQAIATSLADQLEEQTEHKQADVIQTP